MKFGAMLSDSSAYWADKMSDNTLLKHLEDLSILRFSFGPSDFSQSDYKWGDRKKHLVAPEEQLKMNVLARITKLTNGRLMLVAAPWSPPRRLVNRSRSHTEDDLDEPVKNWNDHYAEVLCAWVDLYHNHGIDIDYLSLQNEPMLKTSDYPSNCMSALEAAELRKALYRENSNIKVALYDHNPDSSGIEFVKTLIKESAVAPGDISAWHMYAGNIQDIMEIESIKNGTLGVMVTEVDSSAHEDYDRALRWHTEKVKAAQAVGCTHYMYHNLFLDKDGAPHMRQSEDYVSQPLFTVEYDPVIEEAVVTSTWAAMEAFKSV